MWMNHNPSNNQYLSLRTLTQITNRLKLPLDVSTNHRLNHLQNRISSFSAQNFSFHNNLLNFLLILPLFHKQFSIFFYFFPFSGNTTALATAAAIGKYLYQNGMYADACAVLTPLHLLNRTDVQLGQALAVSLSSIGR